MAARARRRRMMNPRAPPARLRNCDGSAKPQDVRVRGEPVKVECADRLDAAEASAWDGVAGAARLRCPFLGWTWQANWAAVFAEGRRLDVRYVRDAEGRVLAILPLYETESGAPELLGGAEVSDYLLLVPVAGPGEGAGAAGPAAPAPLPLPRRGR